MAANIKKGLLEERRRVFWERGIEVCAGGEDKGCLTQYSSRGPEKNQFDKS